MLGALAQAEDHPVEDKAALARLARHEQLRHVRQHRERSRAAGGLVDGDVAPAEDRQPLVGGEVGDAGEDTHSFGLIGGRNAIPAA